MLNMKLAIPFEQIIACNSAIETSNPIRAVVVPIENYI